MRPPTLSHFSGRSRGGHCTEYSPLLVFAYQLAADLNARPLKIAAMKTKSRLPPRRTAQNGYSIDLPHQPLLGAGTSALRAISWLPIFSSYDARGAPAEDDLVGFGEWQSAHAP